MRESHANKSISFLMELIFVLFFFTLASAVCVLVLGTAKDKNNLAADTRNALQYGENLVAQRKIPRVQQALNRRKRLKKVVGHFVSFVFTAMTKSLYVFPFCWKGAFKNEA